MGSTTGPLLRCACCLLVMASVAPPVSVAAPSSSSLTQSLDDAIRPVCINRMTDRYIAGAVVSVVKNDELAYVGAFGDREVFHEVPVDRNTIFRIGSITKVLTGIAVMQLADAGKLSLDDDVNRHVKSLRVDSAFDEPVRVRHLLTHTAGFDQLGYGRHAESAQDVVPLADFLRGNLVRIRPPGELAVYDTYAITLAGLLVEDVSGTAYDEYLERRIFSPLGMKRSGIDIAASDRANVSAGYGFAGEWEAMGWEYMNTAPASTVNSTAPDMARLMIALLNGGAMGGKRILSREATGQMLAVQHRNDERLPGFGLTFWEERRFGIPAMSHGGGMEGFGALLYLVPSEKIGVFVACNQESSALADAVVKAVLEVLVPEKMREPALEARRDDVKPARFAGSYTSAMRNHTRPDRGGWVGKPFEIPVSPEGDALVFRGKPAYPVGDLVFQREDGALMIFQTDASGAVVRLLTNQEVYDRMP